jgi:hypothetical protein
VSTTLRLEAAGLSPLTLSRYDGYYVQHLDLGSARTREVVEDAPDADGTLDSTAFIGSRVVTIGVRVLRDNGPAVHVLADRLAAFTSPRLRPYLYVQRDEEPERRLQLRRSQWSAPIAKGRALDIVAQWVAPTGVLESAELQSSTVSAAGPGSNLGRRYDRVYDGGGESWLTEDDEPWLTEDDEPWLTSSGEAGTGPRRYPAAEPAGTSSMFNAGTADAYPVLRVYGPCQDPTIENLTQGKALVFGGLAIDAGEFVEIDTRAKTVRFLGLATDSRYGTVVFAESSWWTLSPGPNAVRFTPAEFSAAAEVVIEWRDAWY